MNAALASSDVKTLLKLALPIGSRLITGCPDTQILDVQYLRAHPASLETIKPHSLILVTVSTLSNGQEPMTLEDVIEWLAASEAGALGVRGTLTPRAHQTAKAYGFPLIALPDRAVLPQVERAIQRLFTDSQAQFTQRAFELQQTLQRHAASHRGLTTMLNALARMLDRPVVIYDRRGNVLSRGLPASRGRDWDSHSALEGGAEFIRRFDLDDRAFFEDDWQVIESPVGLTAPLIHEGRLLGYVSVLSAGSAPDEFDLTALEYSAPLFAREIMRQQTLDKGTEAATHTRDWITDWLNGLPSDDALLALRAGKENYHPGLWYAAVLFHWVPANDRAAGMFSAERMVKLIRAEMHQRRISAPISQYADRVVVLFPLDEPQQTQRLKQMVRMLHEVLDHAAPDGDVTIGVGRPVQGLTALRESFKEAERALTLSEQIWAESQVAFFGDLSLYELLLNVSDSGVLSSFCEHWLSPLADYDEKHHTDLLPTLSAYFANNGNMARTAHVLNIHRNTLVYRLGRITDIIQLDMDDPNVRLNLHLALKVQRMLSTEP